MSILKENMGEFFHVALRKGCDSPWSSAMWQTLTFCPDKIYIDFIKHLKNKTPKNNVITAKWIKKSCETWDKYGEKYFSKTRKLKWNDDEYGWATLIFSMFEIMPEWDAECIAHSINYYIKN